MLHDARTAMLTAIVKLAPRAGNGDPHAVDYIATLCHAYAELGGGAPVEPGLTPGPLEIPVPIAGENNATSQ